MQVFTSVNRESFDFFKLNGYCHFRFSNAEFISNINKTFNYYKNTSIKTEVAFRNVDGKPRQYVDVFRDSSSPALNVYRSNEISEIISRFDLENRRKIFTHSKISFKTPNSASDWFAHQDNGYKSISKSYLRNGFAVFVSLEAMDGVNGCLEVFPGSHLNGTLPHKRVMEDEKSGDYQVVIEQIPPQFQPKKVIAEKGDVIVFSGDTIHQSGPTKSKSNRLAIIAEVEPFESFSLDDYGCRPIMAQGKMTVIEELQLAFKSIFNPYRAWRLIKKNKGVAAFIRRTRYGFSR
jgi:ectoine hydroxylase-related dioxygenase (phytanoyl-CoA dioxygenase family)